MRVCIEAPFRRRPATTEPVMVSVVRGIRAGTAVAVCAALAAGCGGAGGRPSPLKNEPEGFGGLTWGIEAAKLPPGMSPDPMSDFIHRTTGMRLYRAQAEDAQLGGVPLARVRYAFYKGRFFMVLAEFRGPDAFERIGRALDERHGTGSRTPGPGGRSWIGERVDILLLERGRLAYVYKPIDAEKAKDEREKRARVTGA